MDPRRRGLLRSPKQLEGLSEVLVVQIDRDSLGDVGRAIDEGASALQAVGEPSAWVLRGIQQRVQRRCERGVVGAPCDETPSRPRGTRSSQGAKPLSSLVTVQRGEYPVGLGEDR